MESDSGEGRASSGTVLYDYQAREDDELTIRRGQAFKVLQTYDDDWWMIEIDGVKGMAPSNYLNVKGNLMLERRPSMKKTPSSIPAIPETAVDNSSEIVDRNDGEVERKPHNIAIAAVPLNQASKQPVIISTPAQSELRRLRALREEATQQIDYLR